MIISFFFLHLSFFCFADSFKINGTLHCSSFLFYPSTHSSVFALPSSLSVRLLSLVLPFHLLHSFLLHPRCSLPPLYLLILFLSSLSLCNPNVLYVVIKQCQTQKLFINNIKQKVSSNGWGGLCLYASLLLVRMHIRLCVCVANRQTSKMSPEAEW